MFQDSCLTKEMKDLFFKTYIDILDDVINPTIYCKLMYSGLLYMRAI